MPIKFLFFLFFLFFTFFADAFSLKDRINQGQEGDFILYEHKGTHTLLFLRSVNKEVIVLEELTIPLKISPLKNKDSIQEWINQKSPGHTSWLEFTFFKNNQTFKVFSKDKKVELVSKDSLFFKDLLLTPLDPILDQERKRKGSPPLPSEEDRRSLWQPPVVFEGKKELVPSLAFSFTESEKRTVILYFSNLHPSFPFPVWIEIENEFGQFHLREKEAGRGLALPLGNL